MADKRFSQKIKNIISKTQFVDFGSYKVKHVI